MAEVYRDWVDYYSRRGESASSVRQKSGYSHRLAQITDKGLEYLVGKIALLLNLQPTDRLLDVGCGAGLITNQLIRRVNTLVGLDANLSMLEHASLSIQRVAGLADQLPFQVNFFDKILSHSVFQLFPDLDYAKKAINGMKRVTGEHGTILIMDILDTAKLEEYNRVKPDENHNLQRLAYDREWFRRVLPEAQIFDLDVPDYLNSQFRFSVLWRF